jgi:cytidylate kinase
MAIITISRGTFTGGQSLADCVAEKLGYRCVSREVLVQAAEQYGASEDSLYKSLVKKPGFRDRRSLEWRRYAIYIQAALCKEVRSDKVVYHGHAGHMLLKGVPHVLRLRVIANIEQRIRAAMERYGMGRKQAIEQIEKADEGRYKWTRSLYDVDWQDPLLYDLVINLDHLSISDACEAICTAAAQEEFTTTLEAQRILDDLALSSDVRARIAADGTIGDAELEVEANEGVVILWGTVTSPEEERKAKEIASGAPGAADVNSKLLVRSGW